ncbi:hypothetical protein ACH4ND_21420 [Streptomyces sp. NPDC017179]|uniref:hypothetical protein n=1 Tax=Streptomyces sp. NPDC017179 TaxID=3364979 RepID=UPI00378D31C5
MAYRRSSTTLDFSGQKVVVIGGTSGMGRAVARHVLDAGGSTQRGTPVTLGADPPHGRMWRLQPGHDPEAHPGTDRKRGP